MRTAFSAFLALIVTLGLFVFMANWVDRGKETEPRAEWLTAIEDQDVQGEWRAFEILRSYIDSATSCKVDKDCTIQSFGCPMDCWSVVAKDQVEFIENTMDELISRTKFRCAYQCGGPPHGARAMCLAGACSLGITQRFAFESVRANLIDPRGGSEPER